MIKWDESWDIVVVGSGLAGLSAAIEAKEAGCSVVVFEKMKVTGGNTRISDGGIAAPNNFLQGEQGVEDSESLFYDDIIRAGSGLNNPELVKVLAGKANEAVEWTREVLGVRYKNRVDRFGGHSVARCLTTINQTGADLIKAQLKVLENSGVLVRTGCKLSSLIKDGNGKVQGIKLISGYAYPDEESGIPLKIQAKKAVIIATGGFGNDVGFRMIQNPQLDGSVGSTNHRGATAEGLVAALSIKAAPVHLSWIQLGPWGCPLEKGYGKGGSFASYSVYPNGILVDPATGKRIVDEWSDRRRRCEAMLKAGHECVGIVDANGAASSAEALEHCLKRGYVTEHASLADLAEAFKMPAGELESTVSEYNRAIRGDLPDSFGKNLALGAKTLEKGPFYAIGLWPKIHYTSGGVGINGKAQVIDLTGRPIPGLFAAGEVCGGVHGSSRLGSCALTECIVFGRISGQQASMA